MHWSETPIHVIDFEGSLNSGIIEYGIVTIQNKEILQVHTSLCRPIGKITTREKSQHGISEEEALNNDLFSKKWELFSGLRTSGIFAAHHAQVENTLIKSVWPYPPKSPNPLNKEKLENNWGPWIDTYRIYETLFPGLDNYKLGNLIKTFGLGELLEDLSDKHCPKGRRKAHCALYDALASSLLLLHLGNIPECKDLSLKWLLINSASSIKSTQEREQLQLL